MNGLSLTSKLMNCLDESHRLTTLLAALIPVGWVLVNNKVYFSPTSCKLATDVLVICLREFVSCVRCIRILSPTEVQQMSLDGEITNNVLQNQACSSSDGGQAWRGQCDQNSSNPSAGSFEH